MGASPSKPTPEQLEELQARGDDIIERAAAALANADVLLVASGAGWSADSGLAVYRDVADVEEYRTRGVTYHDLCQPQVLEDDPALFYGFWGGCFNDYRRVAPHAGYGIIARWRDQLFSRASPAARALAKASAKMATANGASEASEAAARPRGPFFSLTSNVDEHWLRGGRFAPAEVYECHGNTEHWQCADRACRDSLLAEEGQPSPSGVVDCSWRAPPGFAFAVDESTRLCDAAAPPAQRALPFDAPYCPTATSLPHDAAAFACNWPTCGACGGKARPAVCQALGSL